MKKANIIILLTGILLLTGCTRALDVMNLQVQREPLNIEDPAPLELQDYDLYVITEENHKEVFDRLKEKGIDPVLIGLTDEGYEIKSKNDRKVLNYLKRQRSITEEYRNYYENGK